VKCQSARSTTLQCSKLRTSRVALRAHASPRVVGRDRDEMSFRPRGCPGVPVVVPVGPAVPEVPVTPSSGGAWENADDAEEEEEWPCREG
jgi:hypothetical protein